MQEERYRDQNPINEACKGKDLNIVKYLIEKQKTKIDSETLTFACRNIDVLKYFIEKCDVSPFVTVTSTDIDKGWKEISNDNPFNSYDYFNMHIIHYASNWGGLQIVKYFIEKYNINIDIKDDDSRTPLHYAIIGNSFNVIKYLCEKGANIEAKSKDGKTPLLYALEIHNNEVIKYIKKQISIKHKLQKKQTTHKSLSHSRKNK